MKDSGFPEEDITLIRDTLDCNPVFHGHVVTVNQMIVIMVASVLVFGGIYLFMTALREKEAG